MRVLRVGLLTLIAALLVAAAPASAAPRLEIEDVAIGERFGMDGRCYAVGSQLIVIGRGFAPRVPVRVGTRTLRPGAEGAFSMLLTTSTDRAQERVTVRARQGARTATLWFWAGVQGVDVPSWGDRNRPARGTPDKRERVRVGGFNAIGRALVVRYTLGGRQVHRQRVASIRGPCGAAEFTLRQFPFRPVPAGLYRVSFEAGPVSAEYPGVRIGPAPPPSVPLPPTIFGLPGGGNRVAALPAGGYLVTGPGRVDRVDASGRLTRVAGTGVPPETPDFDDPPAAPPGDGGPATIAQIAPIDITVLPDGGFLVLECDWSRIRKVDAAGMITTLHRDLDCPRAAVPLPDGGLVVANEGDNRVLRIAPDGTRTTLAGNGEYPGGGGPGAALEVPVRPNDLALDPDGSLLIADETAGRLYRLSGGRLTVVAGDGTRVLRRDDGLPAGDAAVTPYAIAVRPGGGIFVADAGDYTGIGSEPRLRLVQPDGIMVTLAGSGRFAPDVETTRQDELSGLGMPPRRADFRFLADVAVAADGGVLFTDDPGRVRYLPPPSGGLLGVAVRRDRDRVFAPGAPAHVTLRLSAPASTTIEVAGAKLQRDLPAGETRVELPALSGEPQSVAVTAMDAAGRTASDRAALIPRGWLAEPLARWIAGALFFHVRPEGSYSGDGLKGCRRFAASRVDCALSPELDRCRRALSVVLGVDGRLRWGTYACPLAQSAKPRLQRLRRRQLSCTAGDNSCPPPVFGIVRDRWLVPWD